MAVRVDLNTPGQRDGRIQAFVREPGSDTFELVVDVRELTFQNEGHVLPIDRVFFSTFFGGSSDRHRVAKTEQIDFDNFRLYDNG